MHALFFVLFLKVGMFTSIYLGLLSRSLFDKSKNAFEHFISFSVFFTCKLFCVSLSKNVSVRFILIRDCLVRSFLPTLKIV